MFWSIIEYQTSFCEQTFIWLPAQSPTTLPERHDHMLWASGICALQTKWLCFYKPISVSTVCAPVFLHALKVVWGVVARDSSQHQWATARADRLRWPGLVLWQVSQGHLRPGQCSHEAWHTPEVVDVMGVFSTLGSIPHPVSGAGAQAICITPTTPHSSQLSTHR